MRKSLLAALAVVCLTPLLGASGCLSTLQSAPVLANQTNAALVNAANAVKLADNAATIYAHEPLCGQPTSPVRPLCSDAEITTTLKQEAAHADADLKAAQAGTGSIEDVLADLGVLAKQVAQE
jgi:hypothetical protein